MDRSEYGIPTGETCIHRPGFYALYTLGQEVVIQDPLRLTLGNVSQLAVDDISPRDGHPVEIFSENGDPKPQLFLKALTLDLIDDGSLRIHDKTWGGATIFPLGRTAAHRRLSGPTEITETVMVRLDTDEEPIYLGFIKDGQNSLKWTLRRLSEPVGELLSSECVEYDALMRLFGYVLHAPLSDLQPAEVAARRQLEIYRKRLIAEAHHDYSDIVAKFAARTPIIGHAYDLRAGKRWPVVLGDGNIMGVNFAGLRAETDDHRAVTFGRISSDEPDVTDPRMGVLVDVSSGFGPRPNLCISRTHLFFQPDGDHLLLTNKSPNETLAGGKHLKVNEQVAISSGAIVQIPGDASAADFCFILCLRVRATQTWLFIRSNDRDALTPQALQHSELLPAHRGGHIYPEPR